MADKEVKITQETWLINMENLVREFSELKKHFTRKMQNQKRMWKNLRICLNTESFTFSFSEEKEYMCYQVWTPIYMGFKLDMLLSKNYWSLRGIIADIIFSKIYSNLDPP